MIMRESTDSETLVAVLAGQAEAQSRHPEVDQLLDYHSGKLSSEAAAGVLDHLVGCRRCAQVLLDLEPFPGAAEGPSNVVSLAAVAGWRDFEPWIEERPVERSRAAPLRALYAMAASLLVGVVGLSLWVADLRQTVAAAYEPQTNPPFYDLAPITRSDPEGLLVEVPRDRPFFLLRVIPGTLETFAAVEAELVDAQGRTAWSDDEVELTDSGAFRLSFSRRSLPEGGYRMRVYGLDEGGGRETLVDRKLRVRYP